MNMPLSFVIEYTTQILFPTLQVCRFVKPILRKHRKDVKFYDRTHPISRAACFFSSAEVAVANSKSTTKGAVFCNFLIQHFYLINKGIKSFVAKAF